MNIRYGLSFTGMHRPEQPVADRREFTSTWRKVTSTLHVALGFHERNPSNADFVEAVLADQPVRDRPTATSCGFVFGHPVQEAGHRQEAHDHQRSAQFRRHPRETSGNICICTSSSTGLEVIGRVDSGIRHTPNELPPQWGSGTRLQRPAAGFYHTSSMSAISAASPLRGPELENTGVYPPGRSAYRGPMSSKSFPRISRSVMRRAACRRAWRSPAPGQRDQPFRVGAQLPGPGRGGP